MKFGKIFHNSEKYEFNYVLSKDIAKNMYIVGSWDDWTEFKPFKLHNEKDGNYIWTITLENVYPWHEYKFVYEDNEGVKHWFNYLKDNKTPIDKILKNNLIDKQWLEDRQHVNNGMKHSSPHYEYYHRNLDGAINVDTTVGIDLNEIPHGDAENYDFSVFDYPIEEFLSGFGVWRYKIVPHINKSNIDNDQSEVEPTELLDSTKFERVYIFQEGFHDEEMWMFLIKHKNGNFVYFTAGCDNSGFSCQGGGQILYCKDGTHMWKFGLDDGIRYRLLFIMCQDN